jgi:hypothetical protein
VQSAIEPPDLSDDWDLFGCFELAPDFAGHFVVDTQLCRETEKPPIGIRNFTNDMPEEVPATDWDLADICYATSKDGFDWTEQGVAVGRNIGGDYANRSLSTPDILCVNGKYYLYYQAFTGRFTADKGDYCDVSMARADSPGGPWMRIDKPIIPLGKPGEWDASCVHDPYPIVYKGQIWLYYKSAYPVPRVPPEEDGTPREALRARWPMHGVAVADQPEGPFVKSPLNPISNSGHETTLFPYKEGVVSIIIKDGPEKDTIQYGA